MHWDQREQAALRDAGLSTEDLKATSAAVADATRETADALADFFAAHETLYSDMEIAHSSTEFPEHTIDHVDLYTHSADLRGYLVFDAWGVPIEDGRLLTDTMVELTLGPTVNGRTRFAVSRDEL